MKLKLSSAPLIKLLLLHNSSISYFLLIVVDCFKKHTETDAFMFSAQRTHKAYINVKNTYELNLLCLVYPCLSYHKLSFMPD